MNASAPQYLKTYSTKRTAVKILFAAAVLLIAADLLIQKIYLGTNAERKKLSSTETEEKFRNAVFNFGLEKNWVHKKENNKSGYSSYLVELPPDLPVTVILKEFKEIFRKDFVTLESEEKKINGTTFLKIISGDELILYSQFRYNPALTRKAGEISFLLQDVTGLNEKEDSVLLNSPELFNLVLIPSKESAKKALKISRSGKHYSILLNNEIPELKYNFKENYTEARLKASVREILADFPDLRFILIDEGSAIYRSVIYSIIEKEFLERNIKIFKKGSADLLPEDEDVIGAFNRIAAAKERKFILTTVQNFLLLQPEITKYKKIGCRFVEPLLL
jgi:hypothetical protein